MSKPSVFIGSSTEGLRIAEALFARLDRDTQPYLWTHDLFLPGEYPMDALDAQLRRHDFAVLVASPDDEIVKRGISAPAMRDNLLLEFGLFTGALGRRRAFFVLPSTPQIDLASDLYGIIFARYDASRVHAGADELAAAVQVPCQQIREIIAREWELLKKKEQDALDRIRASERGRAVKSLYGIVVQLRDALMVVQRDLYSAVSDQIAFEDLKKGARVKVAAIVASFEIDARLIGVEPQVEALAEATQTALSNLPFPRELSAGRTHVRERAVETGFGALDTFLRGGDPFRVVERAASKEAEQRVESLKVRYMEWWNLHEPGLQAATTELQDSLFDASVELMSAVHEWEPDG